MSAPNTGDGIPGIPPWVTQGMDDDAKRIKSDIERRVKASFEYGRRIGWNEARAALLNRLQEYGKDSLVCKALAELVEVEGRDDE